MCHRGKVHSIAVLAGTPEVCPDWFELESDPSVQINDKWGRLRIEFSNPVEARRHWKPLELVWPESVIGFSNAAHEALDFKTFRKSVYWKNPLASTVHTVTTDEILESVIEALRAGEAYIVLDLASSAGRTAL